MSSHIRRLAFCLVMLTPIAASAQLAPTGAGYGARASDTGFEGSVDSRGGYSTSVALNLPPVRGGLELPLRIVYTGHGVGTAGLGWDAPLTYILRDKTLSRRRPIINSSPAPFVNDMLTLMFQGKSMNLVRKGGATSNVWVPQLESPQLEVHDLGDGSYTMYDGDGHTYQFTADSAHTTSDNRLLSGNLSLLRVVSGQGNKVQLQYRIRNTDVPGALTIDFANILYNVSSTSSTCFKNEILFETGAPSYVAAGTVFSKTLIQGQALARSSVLATVDVYSSRDCSEGLLLARRYNFSYSADPDTQLPLLTSVTMQGRTGTPEFEKLIQVAKYSYGSASSPVAGSTTLRQLIYAQSQALTLPADAPAPATGYVGLPPAGYDGSLPGSDTWLSLLDITGDGRPDLIYTKIDDHDSNALTLKFVPNEGDLSSDPVPLTHAVFGADAKRPFESQQGQGLRFSTDGSDPAGRYRDYVWRQAIDFNGDGRIDTIDAREVKGAWVVYLNLPGDTPFEAHYQRNVLAAAANDALQTLRFFGFHPDDDSGYIPLGSRITGRNVRTEHCYQYASGPKNVIASWRQVDMDLCLTNDQDGTQQVRAEKTFTEWELRDLNGDGFPDFVFNAGATTLENEGWIPPTFVNSRNIGVGQIEQDVYPSTNVIDAMFNTGGTNLENPHLSSAQAIHVGTPCGVAEWQEEEVGQTKRSTFDHISEQVCGFADANGDGLIDRIEGTTALLQDGGLGGVNGFLNFGVYTMTLPGFMGVQDSSHYATCGDVFDDGNYHFFSEFVDFDANYTAERTAALIDLNGDGIPDYVGKGIAFLGTGVGFGPAMRITGNASPSLSFNNEDCSGLYALTTAGAYDFNGDGKSDFISVDDQHVLVSYLQTSTPSGLEGIGRLVQVDNGFGAKTNITYGSAKDDTQTPHVVPFPEVVVTAVETVDDSKTPAQTLVQKTSYAYGTPELLHDPVYDRWSFSGYRRTIKLQTTDGTESLATITDSYPLADLPGGTALSTTQRFARRLRVGRISDVTTLSGPMGAAASGLLTADINAHPLVIGSSHYTWDAKLFEETTTPDVNCVEMASPYSWPDSLAVYSYDVCTAHGFAYQSSVDSWRGQPGSVPPASTSNMHAHAEMVAIDDFGRPVTVKNLNDVTRPNEQLLTQIVYPSPSLSGPRVLNTPLEKKITTASQTPLSDQFWSYNADGMPTEHRVARIDDIGLLRAMVTVLDVTYDSFDVPRTMTTAREDGATRTATLHFDSFGVSTKDVTVATTGGPTTIPPQTATFTVDQIGNVLTRTDANGAQTGTQYDGFDRPVMATVTPAGGTVGALSVTSYVGFTTMEKGGRSVVRIEFTDLVDPATAPTAPGRKRTLFLDQLGREQDTVVELGTSYSSQSLITGARTYDTLGRVVFEADPYPTSQNGATAYGTTYFYNTDRTPLCAIRGSGPQPFTMVTDENNEIYPTCFQTIFQNNTKLEISQDAASLLSTTPQWGVETISQYSALGQELSRSTFKFGNYLDYETFGYDGLQRPNRLVRFGDPVRLGNAVTTSWRTDSQGNVFELDEPGNAAKVRTYSFWNQPIDERWNDTGAQKDHHLITRYDALGRVVHSEETNNGATDAETVNDYFYDQPVNVSGPATVNATFVLGRLAQAISPTGSVSFSYDGFGRIAARAFTDDQQPPQIYVETHSYHGDGAPSAIDLFLPDNPLGGAARDEHVAYGYDSAERVNSMQYSDGAASEDLFEGTSDVFGRVRDAGFGATHYTADYADTGRRLLNSFSLFGAASANGADPVRTVEMVAPGGEPKAYDPVGRERGRHETFDGAPAITTAYSYDVLGRLAGATRPDASGVATSDFFAYDPLGNVTELFNSGQVENRTNANLSYNTVDDLDRICRVDYGFSHGTGCNVQYDQAGNIVSMPTPGSTRTLDYLAGGLIRTISDDAGNSAHFQYDAFGAVQKLDFISIGTPNNTRHDRHYGSLIDRRDEVVNGSLQSTITRTFPGPEGFVATRHGATATWVFGFGEGKGKRFFSDQNGRFVQDVTYSPYGKAKTADPSPSPQYSSTQWNDGDTLEALGVSKLGARIYDPNIGRFLSRDPLLNPRTAAATNPYAFALNDPVNRADPSGLDSVGTLIQIDWSSIDGTCIAVECMRQDAPDLNVTIFPTPLAPTPVAPAPVASEEEHHWYSGALDAIEHAAAKTAEFVAARAGGALRGTVGFVVAGIGADLCLDTGIGCKIGIAMAVWGLDYGAAGFAEMIEGKPETPIIRQVAGDEFADILDYVMTEGAAYFANARGNGGGHASEPSEEPLCQGGECTCFTAGTPVVTDSGLVPIETIEPGARVHSLDEALCTEEIDPASCREIEIEMENPYGYPETLTAKFLRTREWVDAQGLERGAEHRLEIDELGVDGPARVTNIGACHLEPGPGCVVTGTVTHLNRAVLRLHFVESTEVLEPTILHQLWSADRDGWVPAGELTVGERLLTERGAVTIDEIERLDGVHQVFNFEVAGAHTYLVSGLAIKSHNEGTCFGQPIYAKPADAPDYPRSGFTRTSITRNRINNDAVRAGLRDAEPGNWVKVYEDGMLNGQRVSIHYFQNMKNGKAWRVQTWEGWSNE